MHRVSVVIPAFNEEELLPRCLAALADQARALGAEIVVVDNDSTDRTAEIARGFGATVVHEPRRGYVFALARGTSAAAGDVIAVTDADSMVGPEWLAGILAALEDPGVAGVTGPVAYEGSNYLTWCAKSMPHELWGANMAFRRADLEAVGGIDMDVNLGADIHLNAQMKQRGRIVFDRRVVVTTSSRRFVAQPVRQSVLFTVNYFWLKIFGKSLFWGFAAIRESAPALAVRARRRRAALGVSVASLVALYLSVAPGSSVFGEVVRPHVDRKLVALTFDDGPNGAATRAIVDILSREGVAATFFEIGDRVAADPATARYVAEHGFPIGNHSWDHSFLLPTRGAPRVEREIVSTSAAIKDATGVAPRYFRPPHGWRSPQLLVAARHEHLKLVEWSVDPVDYLTSDPRRIADRVVRRARPGSIVLLHDGLEDGFRVKGRRGREGTIAALPVIIAELRHEGYTFVTLEELLAEQAAESEGGGSRLQRLHARADDLVHHGIHLAQGKARPDA